ncbi:TetR/AcrR family transcriptional regulator [Paenibacillus sp. CAU 1782]
MSIKKRELTSLQLIEAAFELFVEFGLEKTSLGMIAQKVGITKPSIYYHFSTKEELIRQAFDYIFKDHYFKSYFQSEEIYRDNFTECLYQGGLNMLPDADKSHNAVLRVLNEFATLAERDEMYRTRLSAIQQDFLTGFQQLLEIGAELGAVTSGNLAYKAHLLALSIDGISRCKLMGIDMDYEGVWKEAVNSVLKEDFIIPRNN